jgi:hypothetical protein
MRSFSASTPPISSGPEILKAVVLDWAGTTVDFGSVAPTQIAFFIVSANKCIALGFDAYFTAEKQSCIITTFRYPSRSGFDFTHFDQVLSNREIVIYPGKLTSESCFRIGTIGRSSPSDIGVLLANMKGVLGQTSAASLIEALVCMVAFAAGMRIV